MRGWCTRTALFLALLLPVAVSAAIRSEEVRYRDGDKEFIGYLAWDDSIQGKRPGIVVAHEWWGLNDYVKGRARMLAQLGFVAFALDVYGKGAVTQHPDEAGKWSKEISAHVDEWRSRAMKGLEVLRNHRLTDPKRLAALGYCFGGGTVQQMAYAGADLDAIILVHSPLMPPDLTQGRAVKGKMQIHTGASDAFVPADQVTRFEEALTAADIDWHLISYGGARHGFTNPDSDKAGIENVRYDEKADRRSWRYIQDFLTETFGRLR